MNFQIRDHDVAMAWLGNGNVVAINWTISVWQVFVKLCLTAVEAIATWNWWVVMVAPSNIGGELSPSSVQMESGTSEFTKAALSFSHNIKGRSRKEGSSWLLLKSDSFGWSTSVVKLSFSSELLRLVQNWLLLFVLWMLSFSWFSSDASLMISEALCNS